MEFEILSIYAREVLDSRGNPTVEVEVKTKSGISRAIVPSGASTGIHEALELRDCGSRFLGRGVQKAVSNVKGVISKNIVGMDCRKQQSIDDAMIELDGTGNKSGLGANAILGASMAVTRAAALELEIPLYRHIENLANLTGKDKQKTKPKTLKIGGKTHQASPNPIAILAEIGDHLKKNDNPRLIRNHQRTNAMVKPTNQGMAPVSIFPIHHYHRSRRSKIRSQKTRIFGCDDSKIRARHALFDTPNHTRKGEQHNLKHNHAWQSEPTKENPHHDKRRRNHSENMPKIRDGHQ